MSAFLDFSHLQGFLFSPLCHKQLATQIGNTVPKKANPWEISVIGRVSRSKRVLQETTRCCTLGS